MRSYTSSTGNKQIERYLMPPAQIINVAVFLQTAAVGGLPQLISGQKYYLPDVPVISSSMTIGIQYMQSRSRLGPALSDQVSQPIISLTPAATGIDEFMFLTLCDKDGTELFKRVPLRSLIATLRRVKPYVGRIDPKMSYLQFANGFAGVVGDPITLNLQFYLQPYYTRK